MDPVAKPQVPEHLPGPMSNRITVAIAGGSGYVGGELLRLLLDHSAFTVTQITSERHKGSFVHFTHPNLRQRTRLKFIGMDELEPAQLLFLCLPHGQAMQQIDRLAGLAERIVDCSADFRLDDPDLYTEWYGKPHAAPQWLGRFVYGLPELNRDRIRSARYVSGVGCNATAINLAILPVVQSGLMAADTDLICEVKVGSSEAGNKASDASHHPVRAGAMRSFAPVGHRHTAEVLQLLAANGTRARVHMSGTAIDNVRAALATVHLFVPPGTLERGIWKAFRTTWKAEPFVRVVKEAKGSYRYPEPKILAGSNWADVGFALDSSSQRLVCICAIDNLMKGAAGTAVQSANLMFGLDETTGLTFPGLHPI